MFVGNCGTVFDVDGMRVSETYTCAHCGKALFLTLEDRGRPCRICAGRMCPQCRAEGACEPLEAKLKRLEGDDAEGSV